MSSPYGQFAYYYDRLMADMPYREWLRFAQSCWERLGTQPGTVVDLGCGTGSLAVPLAQSGLRVYGIDLSEHMLAVAVDKEERARRRSPFPPGGEVIWLQKDMRELELPEPVDAVVSFCDSLNYLTEEDDLRRTFVSVFRALKPGGTFVFDMHTPHTLRSYAREQPFTLNEPDIAYIWTCALDEDRCEIEHELTLFVRTAREGVFERIVESHVQRAYARELVENELREAGFAEIRAYADFAWDEPSDESGRMFFAAVKRE